MWTTKKIIFTCATVALLVGAGGFCYYYYGSSSTKSGVQSQTETQTGNQTQTAAQTATQSSTQIATQTTTPSQTETTKNDQQQNVSQRERILQSIDCVKNAVMNNEEKFNFTDNCLPIIGEFEPTDERPDDEKLVLLFKLLTLVDGVENVTASVFIESAKPLVKMSMGEDNKIGEFTSNLTIYDHYTILTYFEKNWDAVNGLEWLHTAYTMILKKSTHLKDQFTFPMKQKANKIRNSANAHYLLYKISNSTSTGFEYVERFANDWDEGMSNQALEKFHLELAQHEIQNLDKKFLTESTYLGLQYFARVYCAIRSLPQANYKKLIDLSNLNFAVFDLAIENQIVDKLRRSLDAECKGTKVIETGLQQQLAELNEFTGEKNGNARDYMSLMTYLGEPSEYHDKFLKAIESKVDQLTNATSFTEYVKLLKICSKVGRYEATQTLDMALRKVYNMYFHFVERPGLFVNLKELNEVDQAHTKFYEQNPSRYIRSKYGKISEHFSHLLNTTYTNFREFLSVKQGDSSDWRKKQTIVLKILMHLTNALYNERHSYPVGSDGYNNKTKVIEFFYKLASVDPGRLTEDSTILYEWPTINSFSSATVRQFYTRTDVDAFQFVYRPLTITQDLDKESIVYLCSVNIAEALHRFRQPLPDQVLINILALEKRIGNAAEAEENLRSNILSKKLEFYNIYNNLVQRKSNSDLKTFVDSMIRLILSQDATTSQPSGDITLLRSIFVAIQENAKTAKELLGKDLIKQLGDVSHGLQYKKSNAFQNSLQSDYEKCKNILDF